MTAAAAWNVLVSFLLLLLLLYVPIISLIWLLSWFSFLSEVVVEEEEEEEEAIALSSGRERERERERR